MSDVLPPLALAAVVVVLWGGAWRRRRRFRAAITEASARLEGRYEPGTHVSGGTLHGTLDGRAVVFTFHLGSSSRGPSTTVVATLKRVPDGALRLRGREAVARVPGLKSFAGFFGFGLELRAESNLLSIRVPGVVRDASRLLDLASVAVAGAKELDARRPGLPI